MLLYCSKCLLAAARAPSPEVRGSGSILRLETLPSSPICISANGFQDRSPMRIDKLTTKFQQALGDAQSVAVGQDHQFIEPLHLLAALLDQEDGASASLLSRAGVNVPRLRESLKQAISRLPKVEGHGGEVQISRELNGLLNLTDKEAQKRGDQFISSELFLLALAEDKGEAGRLLKENGGGKKAIEPAVGGPRGGGTGAGPRTQSPAQ